jgi:menaquinone-9 beta-reductase
VPRYKMCSGLLLPSAQQFLSKHFGEIPEECYCTPKVIKGIKISPPHGVTIDICQLSVWRSSFDKWLTQESGAMLKDQCQFLDFQQQNGWLFVKLNFENREVVLKTKYLIGADGANSKVRKRVSAKSDKREHFVSAYEEQWTGAVDLDPDFFYWFLDKRFCNTLYAVFGVKNDRLISVSAGNMGSDVKQCHKNFFDYLKNSHKFRPLKLVHSGGCICNFGSFNNHFDLGSGNVLLVGEAGGFMGAYGEGITTALITGHVAACAVIESIQCGKEAMSIYSQMVEDEKERILAQIEQSKGLL